MRQVLRFLHTIYHLVFIASPPSCRFNPSCSQYLLDATEKYGIFKGLVLSTKRILACHPFSKRSFYDPA